MAAIALDATNATAYAIEDQQRMALAKNYFAWQSRLVCREIGQRVLEIGCGLGNFTGMLLDRDAVMAVDKEAACIARLQQRYLGRDNLRAETCDASTDELLRSAQFAPDSCVCLNVLEHVEDDRALLERMARVLATMGVVVLLVPAFPSLFGPIDRNLGHFRRYTLRSVRELAASSGFHLKKAHFVNAIGLFGWWVNAHILRRQVQSEGQIAFFDRYIVPLASRIEAIAPPFLGQSIFAVLQKT